MRPWLLSPAQHHVPRVCGASAREGRRRDASAATATGGQGLRRLCVQLGIVCGAAGGFPVRESSPTSFCRNVQKVREKTVSANGFRVPVHTTDGVMTISADFSRGPPTLGATALPLPKECRPNGAGAGPETQRCASDHMRHLRCSPAAPNFARGRRRQRPHRCRWVFSRRRWHPGWAEGVPLRARNFGWDPPGVRYPPQVHLL